MSAMGEVSSLPLRTHDRRPVSTQEGNDCVKWLTAIHRERERTIRDALGGNARTARLIAIRLTRGMVIGIFAILAIIAFIVYRLI